MDEPDRTPRRAIGNRSFLFKLTGAVALAGIAQGLFVFQRGGTTIGGFALLLLLVAALLRPALWRHRGSRLALGAAVFFGLVLAADPGFLGLLLYWTMLTLAALLPRAARFGNGWRWTLRLLAHGVLSPFMPLRDLRLLNKARGRRTSGGFGRLLIVLALPLLGTLLFLALFAAANPLIENFLVGIDANLSPQTIVRLFFAGLVFLAAWSLLRPPRLSFGAAEEIPVFAAGEALPGVTPASVTLSLCAFNLLFAVQNGLDLAFLWSGAPLAGRPHPRRLCPSRRLSADRHRPARRPVRAGDASARAPRRPGRPASALLVTLWIAQNLLLVASTMYRTFDYIESYSPDRAAHLRLDLDGAGRDRAGADLLAAAPKPERRLADQRQHACRPARPRRLHLRRSRTDGRGLERAPCPRGRRPRSPAGPLLPESSSAPRRCCLCSSWRPDPICRRNCATACNGCAPTILRDLAEHQADWHGWTSRERRPARRRAGDRRRTPPAAATAARPAVRRARAGASRRRPRPASRRWTSMPSRPMRMPPRSTAMSPAGPLTENEVR